ncbi:MAG: hypothetical protein IPP68_12345 [Elusimicrobia bacterium]|nr:hypothetical protein [Elusimicrobiota bacterium]
MVISLDSTKVSLPKGTPVQTFKNGNEAYLAAEKARAPIIVEYPNRHGQMIRRILGTTDVETEAPTGAPSIVQTIAKKVEDLGGTLGKATPEIVGKAVVETLNSPPDFLNITQEQQARTARNIATSGVSTITGMAGAVPAMSRFVGADGKVLGGFDKAIAKLNEMAVKIAPEDPTFGDKLSQGAASMAAFWVPGMAAEKAISQLPRLGAYAAMIAKAAKIATPTVLESATEQGGVYNDLVQKGMDKEDAAKRSFGAFWKNIILLGITNAIGFGPEAKTRLGQSLMAMPTEGFQEGGQTVIEKISKGEKVDWEEVASDAGVGSILGFAGGSAFGGGGPGVDMTDTATKPWRDSYATTDDVAGDADIFGQSG